MLQILGSLGRFCAEAAETRRVCSGLCRAHLAFPRCWMEYNYRLLALANTRAARPLWSRCWMEYNYRLLALPIFKASHTKCRVFSCLLVAAGYTLSCMALASAR